MTIARLIVDIDRAAILAGMAIDLSAWTGEFHDRPWVEVAERCRVMSDRYPEFQHMTDIVDSILRSGCDQQLAGQTSMHDLIVTTRPISEPPIEEVVVRAPSSLVPVADGTVVIDCLSDRGHANQIAAPVDEAVSLFGGASPPVSMYDLPGRPGRSARME